MYNGLNKKVSNEFTWGKYSGCLKTWHCPITCWWTQLSSWGLYQDHVDFTFSQFTYVTNACFFFSTSINIVSHHSFPIRKTGEHIYLANNLFQVCWIHYQVSWTKDSPAKFVVVPLLPSCTYLPIFLFTYLTFKIGHIAYK